MSRRQPVFLVVIGVLAVFSIWLALRNPKPPFLPGDETHASFVSAEQCLGCHGPGGPRPHSAKHPLGRDCLRCHALR